MTGGLMVRRKFSAGSQVAHSPTRRADETGRLAALFYGVARPTLPAFLSPIASGRPTVKTPPRRFTASGAT